MGVPVVLFDIDHTLVHTTPTCIDASLPGFPLKINGHDMHVHMRPHVTRLLRCMIEQRHWMRFGFWTAGTQEYGWKILTELFAAAGVEDWKDHIAIFLSRKNVVCTSCGGMVKILSRVHKALGTHRVILIDDDRIHAKYNPPGCVMHAPRFIAGSGDVFLRDLVHEMRRIQFAL